MTSVKIGSSFSPASTAIRSAVERPVEQARPEATQAAYTPVDGFDSTQSPRNNALLGNPPSFLTQPGELKSSLEPFRDALDNLASTLDPELLNDPGKMGQFIMDAVKALGILGQDLMDAVRYVGEKYAYNTGNTRLA